jgi:hypothetical protein
MVKEDNLKLDLPVPNKNVYKCGGAKAEQEVNEGANAEDV